MILSLLFSVLAIAGDLNRNCAANNPGLQRFFSEYVDAYAKVDKQALKKMMSAGFWENLKDDLPKKPMKRVTFKILNASPNGEFCHVEWATISSGQKQDAPAKFRLTFEKNWKLDGTVREVED
ncbi:MAG: hypothetical protein ACXWQO_13995 [Bdellovibrionota bacterium]